VLRNHLAAALRHQERTRFYTAISIAGLAIGLWAALLASLLIHAEYSADAFIAGYEHVYTAITRVGAPGFAALYQNNSNSGVAAKARLRFPQIEAVTRTALQRLTVRAGTVEAVEVVSWADPNIFSVLPLPVVAGDLAAALQQPDGLVLSRSMARKYFGREAPLGETLLIEDMKVHVGDYHSMGGARPMVVRAVVEDPPAHGTHIQTGILASGLAAFSLLTALDGDVHNRPGGNFHDQGVSTFFRLKPQASVAEMQRNLPQFMRDLYGFGGPGTPVLELVRIDRVNTDARLYPEVRSRLLMVASLGAVTLVIACANFISLLTALSGRRALEVGIRKVTGAGRRILAIQFIAESTIFVLIAMLVAAALTEWSLPYANAFLDSGARFEYWHSPALLGLVGAATLLLGLLAGAYPARVLSGMRPLVALHGLKANRRDDLVRRMLTILQFSLLIGLMVCATVFYQQRKFATSDALRLDTDQVVMVFWGKCDDALIAQLRGLHGVRDAACTGGEILGNSGWGPMKARDGAEVFIHFVPTQLHTLEVLGIRAVAGSFPATAGGADPGQYAINLSAMRRLGFASPQSAVGQSVELSFFGSPAEGSKPRGRQITAVVPDFSLASVAVPIEPTAYFAAPEKWVMTSIKLTGRDIPEALAGIDALYKATMGVGAPERFFLNQYIEDQYRTVLRQAQAFGLFSLVAILLACLGLLSLAASIAERRTREIGVRKAMGAGTPDIIRLLLWTFARPVLWASLLAWAVAGYAMHRWLEGFAYHVPLQPWVLLACAAVALVIALLTVSVHSVMVARMKPVVALRYE